MYRIIPCFHGVCVPLSQGATRKLRNAGSSENISDVYLLPGNLKFDILKPGEDIIFPVEITIDDQDLQNLDCNNPENFCFTHYGPENQDKPTNQDFGLSGHLKGQNGEISKFSVLADGISNGYAFSQRGAQLSCFAAYDCIKELHAKFDGSDNTLKEANIDAFRNDLAWKLNKFLKADHDHLLSYYDIQNLEPISIAPKVWHKNFKSNPEKWYGNTLIISFLSPFGGFVVYAGDGGIILLKGDQLPKNVMRSDESSTISRFVTLGVTAGKFQGALIGYDSSDTFVEIITVTDGVDRTYQLNHLILEDSFTSTSDLSSLIDQIANLNDYVSGELDIDNYSIGRVFISLDGEIHGRLTSPSTPSLHQRPLPKPVSAGPIQYLPITAHETLKKKDRGMKIALTPLLLGAAIGLGVSNALIIGISKMNPTENIKEPPSINQIAAAEAAAIIAARKAESLMVQETSSQKLLQRLANISKTAEAAKAEVKKAQTEVTAAEKAAKVAAEKLANISKTAEAAKAEVKKAQTEVTAAEKAAKVAAEKLANISKTAEAAKAEVKKAQTEVTAAEKAAKVAAEKLANISKTAEAAKAEVKKAQTEVTAAEKAAKVAAEKLANISKTAEAAKAEVKKAQTEVTAAEKAAKVAAEKALAIASKAAKLAARSIPEP